MSIKGNLALETLEDYVERTTHWAEGGATRHDAKIALAALRDDIDGIERGLDAWRSVATTARNNHDRVSATNRVAVAHLKAVLLGARTHDEQQAADTAARDWLQSIGET